MSTNKTQGGDAQIDKTVVQNRELERQLAEAKEAVRARDERIRFIEARERQTRLLLETAWAQVQQLSAELEATRRGRVLAAVVGGVIGAILGSPDDEE